MTNGEFKTLFDAVREARIAPVISPLIAEPLPPPERPCEINEADAPGDRLLVARAVERFESSLRRLLEEIALEVVGRELLLAPIDVNHIVARLKSRYGFQTGMATNTSGDITITGDGYEIDASLGRRVAGAIERAGS